MLPNQGLPVVGPCWGTVRQASLLELIDVAARYGFPTITATPHIVDGDA